ncbi:phospho-N-acetylmuramoyl-pentapeptide-transferase [Clostridia bacterium]|nr:phospho-N-acetylmuramoyl-pentapeptide-transferase [Clostridia bacterium]
MPLQSVESNLALSIALPFAAACILTAILTSVLIPILKKARTTQTTYEFAPEEHKAKSGTPTMGGIAILIGTVAGSGVSMILHGFSQNLLVILIAFVVFALIGVVDDWQKITRRRNLGLRARHKLALQIIASLVVAIWYLIPAKMGTWIILPFSWKAVDIGPFMVFYIVFIIIAMANAVNLTDGLDGLASGTTFVISIFFPVFAMLGFSLSLLRNGEFAILNITQNLGDAMFFAALAGACIGFLFFNRHPAKIFMGDTGSLAIGGGIAACAIFTRMELLLPIVGFVFVAEVLSDIIQVSVFKLAHGKRVFKMAPLHHHFELSGWHEKKIVAVFVSTTFILCVICAAVLIVQTSVIAG